MALAIFVGFSLMAAAYAVPEVLRTTATERGSSKNRFLLNLRRSLIKNNLDYDTLVDFAMFRSNKTRFVTRTNRRPRHGLHQMKSVHSDRYNFNRFKIISRSNGNNGDRPYYGNNNPERSYQVSQRLQYPYRVRNSTRTMQFRRLHFRRRGGDDVRTHYPQRLDYIFAHSGISTNQAIFTEFTTFPTSNHNFTTSSKLKRTTKDPFSEFRAHMYHKIEKYSAYRYVPTTRVMTTVPVHTFETNALPSDLQKRAEALKRHSNTQTITELRTETKRAIHYSEVNSSSMKIEFSTARTKSTEEVETGDNKTNNLKPPVDLKSTTTETNHNQLNKEADTDTRHNRRANNLKSKVLKSGIAETDEHKVDSEAAFKMIVSRAMNGMPMNRRGATLNFFYKIR